MGSPYRLARPTDGARNLRNNATQAERLLWSRLKGAQLEGLKFSRQMPIAGFICDFVCRSRKLVVELDGSQHADAADYDAMRTRKIEAQGYRLIRFWNNDLIENLEAVLETIVRAALGGPVEPTPLPPSRTREGEEGA
ncbi:MULTISPECIES: endonuclease domain-containing protein [Sphingobium]|uniref:endonuclease domain-containing protein n=1 Tax=Sphingobium TaxID=165695 RepID=UPI000DBB472D|nr:MULTISPECIES: DUF559 domain-containing protein [Sphingobium]KAA9016636.1 endonuclease domain-containing protein [Sphingobium limneticum]MBU0931471.1 DUF559 domain-containing protein [Alphaproteobacteria bacterium]BBC99316.1 crossover junction endodeoxyribonuclease RuvC [Sphingobium sp. YG1]